MRAQPIDVASTTGLLIGSAASGDAAGPRGLRRVRGLILLMVTVILVEFSADVVFAERPLLPFRGVLYGAVIVAAVAASLLGGVRHAIAASAIAGVYSIFFYWHVRAGGTAEWEALAIGALVGLITSGASILAGFSTDRVRCSAQAVLAAEHERRAAVEIANVALIESNAELSRTNEALEAFAYVVSHDLKEPLRALDVCTESLAVEYAGGLPADGRELILHSREGVVRLSNMLRGLLDMSRVVESTRTISPVSISDVLASGECRARFQSVLDARGVHLEIDGVDGSPPVLATPSALAQVLGNLIVNAAKHNCRDVPAVRIRAEAVEGDPSRIEVVVEDDGPGFPRAVVDRFNDADAPPRSIREGGFGLLIVQRAIKNLTGRAWLGDSPEGGAAVHFTLPVA